MISTKSPRLRPGVFCCPRSYAQCGPLGKTAERSGSLRQSRTDILLPGLPALDLPDLSLSAACAAFCGPELPLSMSSAAPEIDGGPPVALSSTCPGVDAGNRRTDARRRTRQPAILRTVTVADDLVRMFRHELLLVVVGHKIDSWQSGHTY